VLEWVSGKRMIYYRAIALAAGGGAQSAMRIEELQLSGQLVRTVKT
jgi:hypothetical protein